MNRNVPLVIVLVAAICCALGGIGCGYLIGRQHAKSQVQDAMQDAREAIMDLSHE